MKLLVALAEQARPYGRIDAMFRRRADQRHRGPRRPARRAAQPQRPPDPRRRRDVMPEVQRRARSHAPFQRARARAARGPATPACASPTSSTSASAASDLGPAMATEALTPVLAKRPARALRVERRRRAPRRDAARLNPRHAVHRRVEDVHDAGDDDQRALGARRGSSRARRTRRTVAKHFVALSTNEEGSRASSASTPENMFVFWDWVGGRYSLWSSIGLADRARHRLRALRAAARRRARDGRALPHRAARAEPARACSACSASGTRLLRRARRTRCCPTSSTCTACRLPAAARHGEQRQARRPRRPRRRLQTGPIVWGEPGTNGQHAFYQLIHQGTRLIPCDFLGSARRTTRRRPSGPAGRELFAQTEALARQDRTTRSRAEGVPELSRSPHRSSPGNRPTNTILYRAPDARRRSAALALYEHKVFTQGASGTSTRSTSGASSSASSSRTRSSPSSRVDEPELATTAAPTADPSVPRRLRS